MLRRGGLSARLLTLLRHWLEAGAPRQVIATVKFQGETDHVTADAFAAIQGARLLHLFHNKHELTFVWARCPEVGGSGRPGHRSI